MARRTCSGWVRSVANFQSHSHSAEMRADKTNSGSREPPLPEVAFAGSPPAVNVAASAATAARSGPEKGSATPGAVRDGVEQDRATLLSGTKRVSLTPREAGAYSVEFRWSDRMIAHRALTVR